MKLTSQVSIKQSQKLVMTQSLQQAIRILQLNQQDLQQEVSMLLDSNIMLEIDTSTDHSIDSSDDFDSDSSDINAEEALNLDEMTIIDTDWDYGDSDGSTGLSAMSSDNEYDPLNQLTEAHQTTTTEDLLWQLEMGVFSDMDFAIGKLIISEINHEGFFLTPLEEIVSALIDFYPEIEIEDIEVVLKRIQKFDPPGIAARTLEESLINQIKEKNPRPSWGEHAIMILTKGVDNLIRLNLLALQRLLKLDEAELREVLKELKQLDPKPGYKIGGGDVVAIRPEVIVTLQNNKIKVALNDDVVPKLRVNHEYSRLARQVKNEEGVILKEHLGEAQNFIRSIHSRFDTLLLVAREIVTHQQAFFFVGESAIRPLQLKDIAEKLELNESTISRAVSGKYLLCPTGTYELKFFFSNQVAGGNSEDDDDTSGVAIRAALQGIIDSENPEKPYSDSRLVALLEVKGFKIARRTVAKYRDVLGVPSSTNRRRIA